MMNVRSVAVLALCGSVGIAACNVEKAPEDQQAGPKAAYEEIIAFPRVLKQHSPETDNAIAAIKKNPDVVVPLLLRDLSYSKQKRIPKPTAQAVFHLLPDMQTKVDLARQIVETYPVGADAPLLQFLAANGDPADLPRLISEIKADPDGSGVSIALAAKVSGNQEVLARLRKLKDEVPGRWTYYFDLDSEKPRQDTK